MGQQVLPSSGNMLIKILAAAISPVQGLVCEQLFPEQSSLIPTTLLPGSQVPQQAVACHLSQVQAQGQQSGTEQAGHLNKQAGFLADYGLQYNPTFASIWHLNMILQLKLWFR